MSEKKTVQFVKSGITVEWDDSCGSILELAEKKGLSPLHGCRGGGCFACSCKLVEGEVKYNSGAPDDVDPGDVLICCSKPNSKKTIVDA